MTGAGSSVCSQCSCGFHVSWHWLYPLASRTDLDHSLSVTFTGLNTCKGKSKLNWINISRHIYSYLSTLSNVNCSKNHIILLLTAVDSGEGVYSVCSFYWKLDNGLLTGLKNLKKRTVERLLSPPLLIEYSHFQQRNLTAPIRSGACWWYM